MSVGQAIGAVGGAVLGFVLPGVGWAIGAQVGMMLGGYIDPPPGPHSEGPRLSDLAAQTSTYGAGKTRAYGTVAVTGNVFWLEGDKYVEHAHEQESGGKGGGGGATQTSYSYTATFAVCLTEGQEITGIRRLWVGDRLIYDAGSDDVESIIASNAGSGFLGGSQIWQDVGSWWLNALSTGQNWKLYTGADDQEAEPRMQADKGAANVSNYPGRAYIVFYDLDLTEHYSNSLMAAQVKAEIVTAGVTTQANITPVDIARPAVTNRSTGLSSVLFDGEFIDQGWWDWNSFSGENYKFVLKRSHISGQVVSETVTGVTESDSAHGHLIPEVQNKAAGLSGLLMMRESFGSLRDSAYLVSGSTVTQLYFLQPNGTHDYGARCCVIDGTTAWVASDNGTDRIQKLSIDNVVFSAADWTIHSLAISDDYLYAINGATTTSTSLVLEKFNRNTLAWISTITISGVDGRFARLDLTDENDFYVYEFGNDIKHIVNHVVAEVVVTDAFGATSSPTSIYSQWFGNLGSIWWGVRGSVGTFAPSSPLNKFMASYIKVPTASASLRDIVTYECGLAGLEPADLDLAGLTDSAVRGYRVTGVSSPRGALEPLQAAWPFDVYQKGYKVGFKSRGGAAVATIEEADLGAGDGSAGTVLLPVVREMETQIARTVTIKHLDADRDYEIGEQTAPERPGVASVEPRQVDLPIVLTASEAMQIADVLNAKEWTERVKFGPFSLPPTYAGLEPADVVTINHRSRSWTARLTRVEYLPDGRLNCDAVLTASAAYSRSASGADPIVLGQSLVPLRGSSRVVLLDIPRIDAAQDVPGISAVMYGFSAGWPGGVLVRSDDQGQTWNTTQGFDTKARVFTVTEVASAANSYSIDSATVLTLTPAHNASALYSITETQLYAHQNLAAWGVDGRWEIVAFRTVTDNTGTYTVKDFLRGLYGTEWATGLHAAGDTLVMLDTTTAGFIGLPTTAINSPRLWRAVTQGAPVSSAPDVADTYGAVNLKPLAPVDLKGSRDPTSFDWTLEVSRRTRWPVEVFSGQAVPVGETAESYVIDLYDATYTTLKRTLTSTNGVFTYTAAQQQTDWAAYHAYLYTKRSMISSVVGRGFEAQETIYRNIKTDGSGYAAAVLALSPSLYYKLDGNSTTVADSSTTNQAGTATATGFTWQQTGLLTGGTGYSVLDTGTGYITTPHAAYLNGAFSVGFLAKISNFTGGCCFYHKGNTNVGGQQGHYFRVEADRKGYIRHFNGSWQEQATTNTILAVGETARIVCVYDGATSFKVYKNGELFHSFTLANAFVNNTTAMSICCANGSSGAGSIFVKGNMDEFFWINSAITAAQVMTLFDAS